MNTDRDRMLQTHESRVAAIVDALTPREKALLVALASMGAASSGDSLAAMLGAAAPPPAPAHEPAPEAAGFGCDPAAVGHLGDDVGTLRAHAERLLRAVAGRNRFATRYAVELAEAVLRATEGAALPSLRSGGAA